MSTDQPPPPVQSSADLLVDVFGNQEAPKAEAVPAQVYTPQTSAPAPASNNLLDGNLDFINFQ